MKINNVNTQYEIPGFDTAPQAFEPWEDGDFDDAPYSRDHGMILAPSEGGWQQLLGLTQSSITATTLDPPTREASRQSRPADTASYSVAGRLEHSNGGQQTTLSPRVSKMMTLLASRQEAVARIRLRAAEVGQ